MDVSGAQQGKRLVEGGAGAHDGVQPGEVGQEVAADVGGLPLHGGEFVQDGLSPVLQRLGKRRKARGEFGIFTLRGEFCRPVQREPEMAAAIIKRAGFGTGALAIFQQFAGGGVQRFGEQCSARVAGFFAEFLQ